MRIDKPTPAASAVARFRSQVVRVRRVLASQGPAFRWSLFLGALAVLVLLGYLATPIPAGIALLRAGQKFPSGDIIKITRALDVQHIDYRVDDQGRIEVSTERLEDAKAVLAKIEIGPRSIEDLEKEAKVSSPWDGPWDRLQKQNKGQEEILAAMIREFDGILAAYVTINRPRAGLGVRPVAGPGTRPTAFVWLETDGGREIAHTTVQSIQNLIVGKEPDLKADAVTVFDSKGHFYLVAGDPKHSTISATRAHEEDLGQRILHELDFIDGVRVTVQLVSAPAPAAASALPSLTAAPAPPPAPPSRASEPSSGSSMGVNTPLELEPEPRPDPDVPSPPASPSPPSAAPSGSKGEVARVWVRVPRSYYYSKAAPDRGASPDRLQAIVNRTESLIREAVAHVVPPELTPPGEPPDFLKIDMIPDDLPASVPLRSQVVTDARRPLVWWLLAAAAGGGLVVLLSVLGVRVVAWRRPALRPSQVNAPRPGRYRSDAASEPGPGPAERVRELIRLNPEAAASVLNRWIGQGESLG